MMIPEVNLVNICVIYSSTAFLLIHLIYLDVGEFLATLSCWLKCERPAAGLKDRR